MYKFNFISSVAALLSIFLVLAATELSAQAGPVVLRVPAEYPTIAAAVKNAKPGDQVIISPGIYHESNIDVDQAITISSLWKNSLRQEDIDHTLIDADGKVLFNLNVAGSEVSGLTIMNGNHPLEVNAETRVLHNHLINNLDAISLEGESGGYIAYNLIENDRDDGIDCDIGDDAKTGSGTDLIIEYNTILNSHDDGIEIRLFSRPNQNTNYDIGNNQIIGSGNAGIQLISYDVPTGKIFNIHHNLFRNCKVALGCMEGGRTVENLKGTGKMDEQVYLYNNTMINNQLAVTGGNHIVAINNAVEHNALGGFKNFGKFSVIVNNQFKGNQAADLIDCSPLTLIPASSPAGLGQDWQRSPKAVYAFAGKDRVVTEASLTLRGEIIGAKPGMEGIWTQKSGPSKVSLSPVGSSVVRIKFPVSGIYEFMFAGSAQPLASKDQISVRYVSNIRNKEHFFDGSKESSFNADEYQYAYGQTSEQQSAVMLARNAALEYSVGIAKTNEYFIWILAKNSGTEAQVAVSYDDRKIADITLNTKQYKWYKLPAGVKTSPGQWSLLLRSLSDSVSLKSILFTQDMDFRP